MWIEANISAPQPPPSADARVSEADEHGDGPQGAESATGKGPPPPRRLVSRAREGRLRTRKDFQQVYDNGISARSEFLVLILLTSERDRARVGVVASKKVGSAVERNRCKRLLREAARRLMREVDLAGIDLIMIARPACKHARIEAVNADVQALYSSVRGRIARPVPPSGAVQP